MTGFAGAVAAISLEDAKHDRMIKNSAIKETGFFAIGNMSDMEAKPAGLKMIINVNAEIPANKCQFPEIHVIKASQELS